MADRITECGRCADGFLKRVDFCRSSFLLNDNCRHILHTVKYRKHRYLLNHFKGVTQPTFQQHFPINSRVIPVPMHWRKRLARGFNQSQILAEWFRPNYGLDISSLRKLRTTTPQVFLTKRQRKQNQGEHYSWKAHSEVPERVVLVDDVLTTGATLEACAKELKRAGVKTVYAWTLFRTMKRATRS